MGFNLTRTGQAKHAIDAAIHAVRTTGQKARDRRAEINDDPALAAPWAKEHRSRAHAEAEAEAIARVKAAREKGYAAATEIREEVEAARQWIERPSDSAQVAGQRLQRQLDVGVPLSTIVQQGIATDDRDGLDWLAYNVRSEAARAVAAGGAPNRARAREVQRQVERLYEAVTDARLPRLGAEDREFHAARRELGKDTERLEAHAALAVAEAMGRPTASQRMKVGLLEDDRWTGLLERAERDPGWDEPSGTGPVDAREPVGADA